MGDVDVTEIVPNLWLGNSKIARDIGFLKKKKITMIINCSKNISFVNTESDTNKIIKSIRKIRIPIGGTHIKRLDVLKFGNLMYPCVLEMTKEFSNNGCILVHSETGIQRGATIICGYLILTCKDRPEKIIKMMRTKKTTIFTPKVVFIESITRFHHILEHKQLLK